MHAARDHAFVRIPNQPAPNAKPLRARAALDAIYGALMQLDGVADSDGVRYVLTAELASLEQHGAHKPIELAPDGDGLFTGFHGWVGRRLWANCRLSGPV